jgi:hypothetical protein
MRKKNLTFRLGAVMFFCVFIIASMAQAFIKINSDERKDNTNDVHVLNSSSSYKWEDTFNNYSKIDPTPPGVGISDNYVVGNGVASMTNTYPAWTNPTWTKMRLINISNNAGSVLTNYLVRLNITRYSGMQTNYNDIRFKRESDTNWLSYYIENTTISPAKVWIKIPSLPQGLSTFYLFYGNPAAPSASDISIFSNWEKRWTADQKISNKLTTEGAWDPDVAYGKYNNQNRFLVGWEEGTGLPLIKQSIMGKIYNSSGTLIIPQFFIHEGSGITYRNENPTIAYGANKFFTPYEHFTTPSDEDSRNIYGRYVDPTGSVTDCFVISDATHRQDDPVTVFNTIQNEFFVTWYDGRANVPPDTYNYNIYAKRYDALGNQIGSEITICSDVKNQMDPWVAYDDIHNRYLVVFEEGDHPHDGPFSLYARIFDYSGTPISSKILLVTGTSSVDNIYPSVAFNRQTQRYLITWNTADVSSDIWNGIIRAKILDSNGTMIKDIFTIDNTYQFVRTDVVPYGGSTFFIAYNNLATGSVNGDIWGKLITSDGILLTSTAIRLSDATSAEADWVNLAVDDSNNIFAVWEDARDNTEAKPDVYANIWWLRIAGTTVTYTIGVEKPLILTGHVTSVQIIPTNMNVWSFLNVTYTGGTISFDVLDGVTGSLLLQNVVSGTNLDTQGITAGTIRLKATFTRSNPSTTPKLDTWSVSWVVNDPPLLPYNPLPANISTGVSVNATLSWSDSDPNSDPLTYDVYFGETSQPPKMVSNQSITSFAPGTMFYNTRYYWKIVAWDNHGASTTGPHWEFTTENRAPYIPYTPTPPNHATGVDTIAGSLGWIGGDPDGDPVTYDIYFGITTPPPQVANNHSAPVYSLGLLTYGTTYYWRIVAWDTHGASAAGPLWNFTTNTPPFSPGTPNPSLHAIGVSVSANLSWSGGDPDVGDTVVYDVYFGTVNPPPKVSANQTDTIYHPGPMIYLTMYHWKIVAWDAHGASTSGPLWDFTTTYTPNHPPLVPSNPGPANQSSGVDITINLNWTGGDPDSGDTVTYDVYFGTTNPPPLVAIADSNTSYDPGTLNYNHLYYWKIIAWDNRGASTPGPIWDFTTTVVPNNPPTQPAAPIPLNHAIDVNISTSLSWVGGDPDPGDTVTYDVYFGLTSPPLKVSSNQTATSYQPGAMDYLTTYHWKIVSWDNHGASTNGPLWEFTTESMVNHPPYLPSDPVPSNHATDIDVNSIVGWNGGDPDPGDTITYDVYFGTTPSPPKVISNQTSTSYNPGLMNYLTTYHWKIVVWDNHGASTQGSLWDFTTVAQVNTPPYVPSNPAPENGSTSVDLTVILSWTGGDPDAGDTASYDVYFGTTNPPQQLVSNQSSESYQPDPLQENITYYWRIIAWDTHDASARGPLWQFTTRQNSPPYEPSNPLPSDHAMNVSLDADLRWVGGDPDGDVVTYDIYFGTTSPPQQIAQNQTQTLYDLGWLSSNTTYYWLIISWDAHHASASGPIWNFTTIFLNDTKPPVVTITKPEKALYFLNKKLFAFFTPVVITMIDIEVTATDNESGVAKVDFFIDNQFKANDTDAPYSWTWTEKGFFVYMVKVVAYDNVGHSASTELRVWKFL